MSCGPVRSNLWRIRNVPGVTINSVLAEMESLEIATKAQVAEMVFGGDWTPKGVLYHGILANKILTKIAQRLERRIEQVERAAATATDARFGAIEAALGLIENRVAALEDAQDAAA